MPKIELSCELPLAILEETKELFNWHFCIANIIVGDRRMADFYYEQSNVIMDNGAFELKRPVDMRTLTRAIELVQPKVVIAPDKLFEYSYTLGVTDNFVNWARKVLPRDILVAGAIQGKNLKELQECYRLMDEVINCDVLCIPFGHNRIEFFEATKLNLAKPHHLLGLQTWNEAKWFKENLPEAVRWTLDTSKPYKAAMRGHFMSEDNRNLGLWNYTEIPSQEIIELTIENIRDLQELLEGGV